MSLPNVINEINTIKSTYLPLSGGSLTGTLVSTTNCFSKGSSTNHMFEVYSGTSYKTGGYISLFGETYSTKPGGFELIASSTDTGQKRLTGLTNGSLTWNSKNIVTSINGVNADVSGNIKIQKQFTPFSETGCSTFDDLPEGFYYINSVPETGRPTSNWGVLRCCRNGGTPFQIYEDDISAKSWKRWFTGGAWTSWIEIPSLSSSWRSGINGFRKWNDGLIEQWGFASAAHGGVFNMHTAFTSTNYCVYFQLENVDAHWIISAYNRNVSSFTTMVYWTTNYGTGTVPCYWYARGY